MFSASSRSSCSRPTRKGSRSATTRSTAFLNEVQARGQAPALDRELVRNALKVQKYLLAGAYRDIDVSDAEIARFYESHLGDYRKTEEIELFQIMVKDREKLLQIRSRAAQPARALRGDRPQRIDLSRSGQGRRHGIF